MSDERTEIDPVEQGFLYFRKVSGGRYIAVKPRLYNTILLIGDLTDDYGYFTHWCYDYVVDALFAAQAWNPDEEKEPEGWMRHAASGRRRPGGDKSKEYVRV